MGRGNGSDKVKEERRPYKGVKKESYKLNLLREVEISLRGGRMENGQRKEEGKYLGRIKRRKR